MTQLQQSCQRDKVETGKLMAAQAQLMQHQQSLEHRSQLMVAAGQINRLKILFLLRHYPGLCVCDLADVLESTVPATSQMVNKLRKGGWLESVREGHTVRLYLRALHLPLLDQLLEGHNLSEKELQK